MLIQNPVLKGFNPDPSLLRVGPDYYLATSTFEWFPGVALYHSRDLAHWRPIGHALTRTSQVDLRGIVDSAGIWAPSLSYAEAQYWLIYTIVHTRVGNFKDVHNYLVTAPAIDGPWSEPIFLNSSGFDPSLFHDDDGRKWLVNVQWDFRQGHPRFAGIILQQYDPEGALAGPINTILQKDHLIEGPNLYKFSGAYYLMLAEGGTGWNHGISLARSKTLAGPYEVDPLPLLMTSRKSPGHPLQKAGHGELVITPENETYMAHLCSRPVYPDRRCILGRETAIQKMRWTDDGWLRLAHPSSDSTSPTDSTNSTTPIQPALSVPLPTNTAPHPWPPLPTRDDFTAPTLSPSWQSLRVPITPDWASLTARPGFLRLRGRESQHSLFEQSLLAQRLTSTRATIQTCLEFDPTHFTQSAGLICYYDTRTHYYLRITHDETLGKILGITLTDDGQYNELPPSPLASTPPSILPANPSSLPLSSSPSSNLPAANPITVNALNNNPLTTTPPAANHLPIAHWPRVHLRAVFTQDRLQFSASPDALTWTPIGPPLDATKLSDDYGAGMHFTGTLIALCAQDLRGTRTPADFDYFEMIAE